MIPASTSTFYIRLHRRHGTHERILPASEVEAWAQRLKGLRVKEIHFLIGTDWEDAPVVNMKALSAAVMRVCPEISYDWAKAMKERAANAKGSIAGMFSRAVAAGTPTKRPREEEAGAGANSNSKPASAQKPAGPPAKKPAQGGGKDSKAAAAAGTKPLSSFFTKK